MTRPGWTRCASVNHCQSEGLRPHRPQGPQPEVTLMDEKAQQLWLRAINPQLRVLSCLVSTGNAGPHPEP